MLSVIVMLVGAFTHVAAEQRPSTQAAPKTLRVHVVHQGEDRMGIQLAYAVRERLRVSSGLPLELEQRKSNLTLSILSIETPCAPNGGHSSAAVSLESSSTNRLIGLWVVQVTSSQIETVSTDIVAKVDKAVQDVLKLVPANQALNQTAAGRNRERPLVSAGR